MRFEPRRHISPATRAAALAGTVGLLLAACTSSTSPRRSTTPPPSTSTGPATSTTASRPASSATASASSRPAGEFTINVVGDVNFAKRTATLLSEHPGNVFMQARAGLDAADLTMVNLETAITDGHGTPQAKEYHFHAPPAALAALRAGGVDVATMANNHGADYGTGGLRDTLAAIKASHFPVIGIGKDANAAFAPYRTTLNGTRIAIFAADQVDDETTLRLFSAGPHKPGVANAYRSRLVDDVRRAHQAGYVVLVYLHWGVELHTCPSNDQTTLAGQLADAGAAAVVGTHAHVLQGAGWRANGTYVDYGLGNYLWWESYHNNQDDNGVLTMTFRSGKVVAARFAPSHLDSRGVPLPATGATKVRIEKEIAKDRACTTLAAHPPA